VGKPGDRKDYYQMAPDFLVTVIRHRVSRWRALHDLGVEMRRTSPNQPAVVRERLDYLDNIHEFVLTRIDDALAEWESRAAPASRTRARAKRASS
jgi:DNA-binding transcriptional regulator GbsR (MarR family)